MYKHSISVCPGCGIDRDRCRRLCHQLPHGDATTSAEDLPIMSQQPPTIMGVTSEAFAGAVWRFCKEDPDGVWKGQRDCRISKKGGWVELESCQKLSHLKFKSMRQFYKIVTPFLSLHQTVWNIPELKLMCCFYRILGNN